MMQCSADLVLPNAQEEVILKEKQTLDRLEDPPLS